MFSGAMALVSAIALLAAAPPVWALAIDGGTTVTVPGTYASPWNVGDRLTVGNTSSGFLVINAGGIVSSLPSNPLLYNHLGESVGSAGTVTISGPGARWNAGSIGVGFRGEGTLTISNGGWLDTDGNLNGIQSSRIGDTQTGIGEVTVTGAGSGWTNNYMLFVGFDGTGTLTIAGGGSVTNQRGVIGNNASAQGTVTVSGSGSKWINDEYLVVGWLGTGVLTISNGGEVSSSLPTYVGQSGDVSGTLNIGADKDSAPVAPGILTAPSVALVNGNGSLVFNHTDTSGSYVFAPRITDGSATLGAVGVYAGATVMTGASSYSAPTTIHGGTLAAGAASVFSANSNYAVQTAGTMNLRGNNQTVRGLTNAGTVSMGMGTGTAPGTVLTVRNNYGGSGGMIMLNTALGDDSSATDKLVVNGNTTTGTTRLHITNVGGVGAATTDGILVVEVVGTSDGTFVLNNRPMAGDYEYTLVRGASGTPNENNWYLQASPRANPPAATPVPTLDHMTLALLTLLMAGGAAARVRRKAPGAQQPRHTK